MKMADILTSVVHTLDRAERLLGVVKLLARHVDDVGTVNMISIKQVDSMMRTDMRWKIFEFFV